MRIIFIWYRSSIFKMDDNLLEFKEFLFIMRIILEIFPKSGTLFNQKHTIKKKS